MTAKALALAADEIVLDLEDGVAAADKAAARRNAVMLLRHDAWRARTVAVRVNAIGSPWWEEDLAAIAAVDHPGLTLVIPKVEGADDLGAIRRQLGEAPSTRIGLQALIETAAGIANVVDIAGAGEGLQSLIVGYADLASSLGRPAGAAQSWQTVQDMVVIAARANDLQPIDGPHFQIKADDSLRRESERARDQGFDGKWAIHPSHIEPINAAFTPSDDEIAEARALLAHLGGGGRAGASAHDGRMVDEAMRLAAVRVLARAGIEE